MTNQKGGVGKTTTAINLSASLADLGARVLLVDLDPQGNATTGMGLDRGEVKAGAYELLTGTPAAEAITATDVHNLWMVPSTIDLAGAEVELVSAFAREMKLRQALSQVSDRFDFIIIDSPPSLGLLAVNALAAAHEVVVPIQCEYYALEGVSQLLRTLDLIREGLNPTLVVGGVVLTMFDARTKLAEQVVSEVKAHFGDVVFRNVIPRSVRLSEAPGFGRPITRYAPGSRAAFAYRDLAREALRRWGADLDLGNQAQAQAAQPSLLEQVPDVEAPPESPQEGLAPAQHRGPLVDTEPGTDARGGHTGESVRDAAAATGAFGDAEPAKMVSEPAGDALVAPQAEVESELREQEPEPLQPVGGSFLERMAGSAFDLVTGRGPVQEDSDEAPAVGGSAQTRTWTSDAQDEADDGGAK